MAWVEDGNLKVQADRYHPKGADPDLILAEIRRITRAERCESFDACVRLEGLWWSPGTHAGRQQSSDRCLVLSRLRELGCKRFVGSLTLAKNDLDDCFLEKLCRLLWETGSTLEAINLDENRITTNGVVRQLSKLSALTAKLSLNNNAIDQVHLVREEARQVRIDCEVWPDWTEESGREALNDQDSWWKYFYGPVQLLRAKILDLPRELPMVECPICEKVLKHDTSNRPAIQHDPAYTVAGNLATHLCGAPHRKKLKWLSESLEHTDLPNIIIVSPRWSIFCPSFKRPAANDLSTCYHCAARPSGGHNGRRGA
ncbi:unnamed protein product [Durusdinium trenchii]|uniref:Uncharacterized protein n=1 Tax=Durusdinium trenchii TaxID=1381693 RepID=A0ABP0S6K8_9DINO